MEPPMTTPPDTFSHRHVPALGRQVHRIGLAGNYGLSNDEFAQALRMGPQYVFWTSSMKKVLPALRDALAEDRARYVIATGPTLGFTAGSVRSGLESALKKLNTDYIDVLQIFWLGKTSAWRPAVIDELVKLREEGLARRIGLSIHDRERAAQLAIDSPLDLLMIRYNAAHPGAERDIFPHLHHRRPAVLAYTATAWGKLLQTPAGWTEPSPQPRDCYRFALSNPHVDLVLTGPANLDELKHNLSALDAGPLSDAELDWMRRFGEQARHGVNRLSFFGN
jgi:aryl-alcohol dehydrogenase-like predicted oxidoreductase